ncbi:MAG: aminotransferase class V-fold PLP-dependent enzyme [Candidatus Faecivicinus sp.]|nr:aminotransferase class V-fold PLP-dependent enzyme [Candidatus Faecivicinus sp.]
MNLYFDNAATSSPKPQIVLDRIQAALTEFNANPGRSGHPAALAAAREVLACREALTALLGCEDPARIAFAFNCTDALNLAIKGVLRYGDHAIATQLEHNSVLRPLSALAARGRISLSIVPPRPDGFVSPDDIRAAIRKNTRLIAVTHASNVTGAIQPVAAIGQMARREGVCYLIDGAQALGALPVSVRALGCDLYAFPGHKSLLGPMGTGGLYIRPGLSLRPLREGGTGTDSESVLQPESLPEKYESGTLNLPGIAGLGAGCAFVKERVSAIMAHERELTQAVYEGLSAIPGAEIYSPREEAARAGIVSFNLEGMTSSDVSDRLANAGIAVRGGLHCAPGAHRFLNTLRRGAVRASVGYANTFEEVDAFLAAVKRIAKGE